MTKIERGRREDNWEEKLTFGRLKRDMRLSCFGVRERAVLEKEWIVRKGLVWPIVFVSYSYIVYDIYCYYCFYFFLSILLSRREKFVHCWFSSFGGLTFVPFYFWIFLKYFPPIWIFKGNDVMAVYLSIVILFLKVKRLFT